MDSLHLNSDNVGQQLKFYLMNVKKIKASPPRSSSDCSVMVILERRHPISEGMCTPTYWVSQMAFYGCHDVMDDIPQEGILALGSFNDAEQSYETPLRRN